MDEIQLKQEMQFLIRCKKQLAQLHSDMVYYKDANNNLLSSEFNAILKLVGRSTDSCTNRICDLMEVVPE